MGILFINNVPIVTPNITSDNTPEPNVCPDCGKPGPVDIHCLDCEKTFDHGCARNDHEFTFECRSCGYKYEIESPESGWYVALQIAIFVVIVLIASALLIGFIAWADHAYNDPNFDQSFFSYLFKKLSQFWRRVVLKIF